MHEDSTQRQQQRITPPRMPGCAMNAFVAGLLGLGVGIWLLNRWNLMQGLGKAGTIILIVLSTLMMLPMLLIVLLGIFMRIALRRMTDQLSKAGAAMLDGTKAMYEKIHEFRDAREEDFDELDRDAYEAHSRYLLDGGWRHLGDVVDATIEQISGVTPVIRVFASPDGTTVAGIYDFKAPQLPPQLEGKPMFMYDLASEFDDGEMLLSANSRELDMMTSPPQFHRQQFDLSTPLAEIERSHEVERQRLLAANGGSCTVVTTLAEAMEMERRQQEIKNAFRKGIGFIDPEEVKRIASTVHDDDEFAERSAEAADQARKKSQRRDP